MEDVKKKRYLFLGVCAAITVAVCGYMNTKYDRLARYPYEDQEARELIDKHLNNEEIDYIIEYSIAPVLIKPFIEVNGFNIYHAGDYYALSQLKWELSPEEIVEVIEKTIDYVPLDELVTYLDNYSFDEYMQWIEKGSKSDESILIPDAAKMDAYVDDNRTVYRRIPFNLVSLPNKAAGDDSVIVDKAIQLPLEQMCAVIKEELESDVECAGLYVDTGYISYEGQKALFNEAVGMYGDDAKKYSFEAGHSEHQLGLAIDFKHDDDFVESEQYLWLKDNAYRFGFIESYNEENEYITKKKPVPYHWRFVGCEIAQTMKLRDISLVEYLEMKE